MVGGTGIHVNVKQRRGWFPFSRNCRPCTWSSYRAINDAAPNYSFELQMNFYDNNHFTQMKLYDNHHCTETSQSKAYVQSPHILYSTL
uniref:Transcriptional corepressor LEUNIG n=1 Tax=Rhizophora mucronata TaxID=61149 RepID=A0A2P2MFW8_RHIMU